MISEAQTRIFINKQLEEVGWDLTDHNNVQLEEHITDTGFADYVLKNKQGHPIAVVEAKRENKDPRLAESQAKNYAISLNVPFLFLANGEKTYFWEYEREAYPSQVKTFFSQRELDIKYASHSLRQEISSIPIDGKIVERDYAKECIEKLSNKIDGGTNKLLVEMATGAGKTRLAAAFIKRLFKANRINKVLFICDRITLAKQTEDTFTDFLPDYSSYVLNSKGFKHEKQITISTLQTMIRSYATLNSGYYDLIIIDECHRSIYGKYRNSLDHFHAIKLGLTATPCTSDEETASDEDISFVRDTLRFFDLKEPTFTYGMDRAIEEGYLLPYYTYQARTVRTGNEAGIEVKRNEIDWNILTDEDKEQLEEVFKEEDKAIFPHTWLERKITIPERNKSIAKEFRDVIDNGFNDTKGKKHLPPEGKTIVFAVTKSHAVTLAKIFDDIFQDKKPSSEIRYADYVVSEMGEDDSREAQGKIKQFKDEEFPKILVSVGMLDTGFDCPEITNLVHARFTKSNILYRQMRGRGSRKADHINKKCFWMFDFVGVTQYHKDDEDSTGGLVTINNPPVGPTPPTRLVELDVDDWIDPASRAIITLDENGNIQRPLEVMEKAERVGIKYEGWLSGLDDLDNEKEKFMRVVGEQIKSNVMDTTQIDDSFFGFPPFLGIQDAITKLGGPDNLKKVIKDINQNVLRN